MHVKFQNVPRSENIDDYFKKKPSEPYTIMTFNSLNENYHLEFATFIFVCQ